MTTTDARKRNRDMADAHETARARDARAKAGHPIEWFVYDETQTFTREHLTEALHVYLAPANPRPGDVVQYLGHATTQARDAAWMLGALDGTGEPRTRTHHIDTETGQFTLLDNQEDTMDAPNEVKTHVTIDREQVREAARLAAELFITEYASRLVEAVDPNYLDDEPVEDCGCPPRVHVNPERTDWLDEPVPVPRPEPAPADVDPDEALAKVIHKVDDSDPHNWPYVKEARRGEYRSMARAAREHIEANQLYAYRPVAAERDEAEADLARVTKERDQAWRFRDAALEARDKAQAKAGRYDALRADVVEYRDSAQPGIDLVRWQAVLTRDDERAAKGVQS